MITAEQRHWYEQQSYTLWQEVHNRLKAETERSSISMKFGIQSECTVEDIQNEWKQRQNLPKGGKYQGLFLQTMS